MSQLVQTLYLFSTALLVPVIVLLFALVLHCLLEFGGLLREWQDRRNLRTGWQAVLRSSTQCVVASHLTKQVAADGNKPASTMLEPSRLPGLMRTFARRVANDDFQSKFISKHLDDIEIESSGRLSRLSFVVRIGPMLGLMGTLIPLGPALLGLSSGDMSGMANDLVVAFSTTVLGLLVGGMAYFLWLVRRHWYAQDITDIDFVCRTFWTGTDAET